MKKLVISGSFRKAYPAILEASQTMKDRGYEILSPHASQIVNPGEEFARLECDQEKSPYEIEQTHLNAISEADALYVVNPNGYIGRSVAMEIGWAKSKGKPVYFQEKASEELFNSYGKTVSAEEMNSELGHST